MILILDIILGTHLQRSHTQFLLDHSESVVYSFFKAVICVVALTQNSISGTARRC